MSELEVCRRRPDLRPAADHGRDSRRRVRFDQVTHSDVNAAYGNRIIRLKDGWIQAA
jgi:hypothetical protein